MSPPLPLMPTALLQEPAMSVKPLPTQLPPNNHKPSIPPATNPDMLLLAETTPSVVATMPSVAPLVALEPKLVDSKLLADKSLELLSTLEKRLLRARAESNTFPLKRKSWNIRIKPRLKESPRRSRRLNTERRERLRPFLRKSLSPTTMLLSI